MITVLVKLDGNLMPWRVIGMMDDEELGAIYAYRGPGAISAWVQFCRWSLDRNAVREPA